MDWVARIAERKIQEAMERGAFDDSPMRGKPLVLENNPYVPGELRVAYKLLKDAGFLPEEMELRKEIWTLRELLRAVEDDEERYGLIRRINDRVLRLNLLWKRSFSNEDRQLYAGKLSKKLG